MARKSFCLGSDNVTGGFFTHAEFTDELRATVESELNLKLPEQYVNYLKAFGHGGVGGVDILGVGCDGSLIFVEDTKFYRQHGLPLNLVVIENHDEWLSCTDCNTGKIVSWTQEEEAIPEHDCFDDYVLDEFKEAIDNL